ncbi:DUF6111 family protein [Kaistia sp. MMO-174]|uniref:DUF6111 family protein n=1 Tax=Kaistia sp. MMO-174 TaxID=3081256 RepID=UPI001AD599E7|nr:hypothetical protein [Hyphomicrobiales bacterium]MBN9059585.1 hypothetical protein [Hyphomicrobiales bacterium]
MLRFLAITLLCFLAPFLVYAGWRQLAPGQALRRDDWSYPVLSRLSAAGVVLVLIAVLGLVHFSGGSVGTTYHPAEFRDGKLVPGGFD